MLVTQDYYALGALGAAAASAAVAAVRFSGYEKYVDNFIVLKTVHHSRVVFASFDFFAIVVGRHMLCAAIYRPKSIRNMSTSLHM